MEQVQQLKQKIVAVISHVTRNISIAELISSYFRHEVF